MKTPEIPCPPDNKECKYFNSGFGCRLSEHHDYWPRSSYNTTVEKLFRRIPPNIHLVCRLVHDEIHATQEAPKKPSLDTMRDAIMKATVEKKLFDNDGGYDDDGSFG